MKKVFFLLAIVAVVFASCGKDKVNNLDEKLMGKWMIEVIDGQPALTNDKIVTTFVSPTKALISSSFVNLPEGVWGTGWHNQNEWNMAIDGDKATLTCQPEDKVELKAVITVKNISETEVTEDFQYTATQEGVVVSQRESTGVFKKVTDDFSQAIVGKWQGRCTSGQSLFDDGQEHQWEYFADGSYVYYSKDENDQWVAAEAQTQYFVDGTLLFTRWQNTGERENREWWVITSIENDVMNWTALRQDDNGNTFAVTFSMTKVSD